MRSASKKLAPLRSLCSNLTPRMLPPEKSTPLKLPLDASAFFSVACRRVLAERAGRSTGGGGRRANPMSAAPCALPTGALTGLGEADSKSGESAISAPRTGGRARRALLITQPLKFASTSNAPVSVASVKALSLKSAPLHCAPVKSARAKRPPDAFAPSKKAFVKTVPSARR